MGNPATLKQQRYISFLRDQLGIDAADMPATSREANAVIRSLLQREAAEKRSLERERKAAAPPSLEVADSIRARAERLGLSVVVPASASEAAFVLDDLRHRERMAQRVADGSAR